MKALTDIISENGQDRIDPLIERLFLRRSEDDWVEAPGDADYLITYSGSGVECPELPFFWIGLASDGRVYWSSGIGGDVTSESPIPVPVTDAQGEFKKFLGGVG